MTDSLRILIIIVLYKQNLRESQSYVTLKGNVEHLQYPSKLVLYNNSIEKHIVGSDDEIVINSGRNDKLAKPYNYAWRMAKEEGYEWIMLLDQDSELTSDYFIVLNDAIRHAGNDIAAVVPQINCNGTIISPTSMHGFSGPFWTVKRVDAEVPKNRYVSAINSAALVRTSAMTEIGGFNEKFPLDYLDCWYFYQFHKHGFRIKTMPSVVNHQLSILSLKDMGRERYRDYMQACARFARSSQPSFYVVFVIRTLLRSVKCLFVPSKRKFAYCYPPTTERSI